MSMGNLIDGKKTATTVAFVLGTVDRLKTRPECDVEAA